MQMLAGAAVVAFALFLIGLGAVAVLRPAQARQFLGGFAGTLRVHVAELAARLVVGIALIANAPAMAHPEMIRVIGWAIVGTTLVLALVPWRWHRRFARRVVPVALHVPVLFGLASAALGAVVLYSVAAGRGG